MTIKTANRINRIQEYFFSKKLKEIAAMRANGKDVINLGIGSPDLAPADEVISVLNKESKKAQNHCYQSYIGATELRNAFSKWYKSHFEVTLDPDSEILPLIGSKEGIMHISMTYLEEGDHVLIPNPGYPAYKAAASLSGATAIEYQLSADKNWMPDLEALSLLDLSKVKIMWLNYPHMPTGAQASRNDFEKLVAFAVKHQILLVNDNPYSFILNDNPLSLLSVDGAHEVALELNSLSKSHNMAGWRIGMIAGGDQYLSEILKFKSNMDSGMFLPVQLAAVKALNLSQDWYDNLNQIYRERQLKVFQIMDLLGCNYDRQQGGMFVWAKVPESAKSGFDLSTELLSEAHVFVTPGGIFGSNGNDYIRISLCNKIPVFEQVINRIRGCLDLVF